MKDKENTTKNLILPLPLEFLGSPHFIDACFKTGGRAPPLSFLKFHQIGDEEKHFSRSPQVLEPWGVRGVHP